MLLGVVMAAFLQVNPFAESGYWLLEKILAFVVYLVMVHISLNEKTRPHMQWLTFVGAFGWLFLIAKVAFTKQAILLVG
jgi:uncharacterized membrane protein SirB2